MSYFLNIISLNEIGKRISASVMKLIETRPTLGDELQPGPSVKPEVRSGCGKRAGSPYNDNGLLGRDGNGIEKKKRKKRKKKKKKKRKRRKEKKKKRKKRRKEKKE